MRHIVHTYEINLTAVVLATLIEII